MSAFLVFSAEYLAGKGNAERLAHHKILKIHFFQQRQRGPGWLGGPGLWYSHAS